MSLVSIVRTHSSPMLPISTGATAHLPRLSGIRGVVFDIYGTLFLSGSGDISLAQSQDREGAMREALSQAGIKLAREHPRVTDVYYEAIRLAQEARREKGIANPEVEIREIWRTVLAGLALTGDDALVERLAVLCECLTNPVWPMSHLPETLYRLQCAGLALGIVSNAQFYTPLLFEALLGKGPDALGFDADLCVWSYREREGKPSMRLYARLAERLAEKGITPPEALYVGNDMRNDIWPALETGFRTALFAGDARSLRLREDDPRSGSIRPDAVVTNLEQVVEVAGCGG